MITITELDEDGRYVKIILHDFPDIDDNSECYDYFDRSKAVEIIQQLMKVFDINNDEIKVN